MSPRTPRLITAAGVFCMAGVLAAQAPKLYDGRSLDEWRDAIQQLDFKSPSRASAVPGLRAIINDAEAPWFTRRQAALTLGRIGEPASDAVEDLIRLLEARGDSVETSPPLWSLKALALFGPLAASAAPRAIALLEDPAQPIIVRLTATETLGRIGTASSSGIQALIQGGSGRFPTSNPADNQELRIVCIEALQLAAPPSAVPMLIAASSDPADRVRHAAAATLGFLGARAEPAGETLGSLVVFDEIPVVREAAARSVAKLGESGIPILRRLLENEEDDVVLFALDAVARMTSPRRELGPAVEKLFASANPIVAVRALNAWWAVTRDARPILTRLVQAIEHEHREVRKVASDTLVLMGPAALPATAHLRRIAAEGTPQGQAAAQRVLRALPAGEAGRSIKDLP